MSTKYLVLIICLCSFGLPAQTDDLTDQDAANDRTKNDMFNRQDPSAALQAGGAFYVSNPAIRSEIDVNKAYLRTGWEDLIVRMIDGNTATVRGRYRIVDQRFEIKQDDGIYEMRNNLVREAQLGEDYFVMLPFQNEMTIFQVHYRDSTYNILTHHYTEWKEPGEQKLYDTSERKRTLKRKETQYLLTPFEILEADKKQAVLNILMIRKGMPAYDHVRRQKWDVRKTEDLATLLEYLEENDLVNPYHKE